MTETFEAYADVQARLAAIEEAVTGDYAYPQIPTFITDSKLPVFINRPTRTTFGNKPGMGMTDLIMNYSIRHVLAVAGTHTPGTMETISIETIDVLIPELTSRTRLQLVIDDPLTEGGLNRVKSAQLLDVIGPVVRPYPEGQNEKQYWMVLFTMSIVYRAYNPINIGGVVS